MYIASGIVTISARFLRVDRFGYQTSRILLTTRRILEKYPREGYRSRVVIR